MPLTIQFYNDEQTDVINHPGSLMKSGTKYDSILQFPRASHWRKLRGFAGTVPSTSANPYSLARSGAINTRPLFFIISGSGKSQYGAFWECTYLHTIGVISLYIYKIIYIPAASLHTQCPTNSVVAPCSFTTLRTH